MYIAAEITSSLQCIFVLSLILKKYNKIENLKIDFLFLNIGVNENTIESVKNIIKRTSYNIRFKDLRNYYEDTSYKEKIYYDILIIRSRIQIEIHNNFSLSKKYFSETGNCKNSKKVIQHFHYKKLYTVDDGVSNWKKLKHNYLNLLIANFSINFFLKKKFIVPLFFKRFFFKNFFIEHYSIYSKNKNYKILKECKSTLFSLGKSIKINPDVENLFIGIWPNIPSRIDSNRLSGVEAEEKDEQLEIFWKYLNKNKLNDKKIYIKEHQKHVLKLDKKYNNFIKLSNDTSNLPIEILISSYPNLKNIYGFPSTVYNMINLIYPNINVCFNLLNLSNDTYYFSERVKLIKKSKNLVLININ